MKQISIFLSVILMLSFMAVTAFAQQDDDDDDTATDFGDSTVKFDSPDAIEPLETYAFELTVTNMEQPPAQYDGTKQGEWIWGVDLTMPSFSYEVDSTNLDGPAPLHSSASDPFRIDRWEALYDPYTATIYWQSFGAVTSASIGDIRESESLQFAFTATVDEEANNGFMWAIHGDLGTNVTGIAMIGADDDDDDGDDDDGGEDDDDFIPDDEDDEVFRVDDGDDSSGCCG